MVPSTEAIHIGERRPILEMHCKKCENTKRCLTDCLLAARSVGWLVARMFSFRSLEPKLLSENKSRRSAQCFRSDPIVSLEDELRAKIAIRKHIAMLLLNVLNQTLLFLYADELLFARV